MNTILTVYVAGPYTDARGREWQESNVLTAIQYGEQVAKMGLVPFIPHLDHYWDDRFPHEYLFWITQTLVWMLKCDAVLRIPGFSRGADEEVRIAHLNNIPVFHNIPDLKLAIE